MYYITYHESIRGDLEKITKTDRNKIQKAIEKKMSLNPVIFGEPLRSNLTGYRKLRVGEYRIVYQIIKKENTLIIIIAHRRNVYESVKKRLD